MTTEDKRPHWKFVSDFIQQSAHPVTLAQIKEHFKAHERNPANAQPDATAVSVNESSRVHFGAGRETRRTDSGNRYDLVNRNPDRSYVPYRPAAHGVREIYQASDGTRGVRKIEGPGDDGEDEENGIPTKSNGAASQDGEVLKNRPPCGWVNSLPWRARRTTCARWPGAGMLRLYYGFTLTHGLAFCCGETRTTCPARTTIRSVPLCCASSRARAAARRIARKEPLKLASAPGGICP